MLYHRTAAFIIDLLDLLGFIVRGVATALALLYGGGGKPPGPRFARDSRATIAHHPMNYFERSEARGGLGGLPPHNNEVSLWIVMLRVRWSDQLDNT